MELRHSASAFRALRTACCFSAKLKKHCILPKFYNSQSSLRLNKPTVRFLSNHSNTRPLCTELKHRSLVRVAGEDAAVFLQGLITNDIRCLDHGCHTLYAMMLNVQVTE